MQADDALTMECISRLGRQARCAFVEHGGRKVCWRGFGTGRPMVLLHGGHGNWLHWVRNIEALSAHHAVWVPDMPGYGDSDLPEPHGGLASMVTPLIATLDKIVGSDTPVDLVGFSFGGLVSAHMSAQRPLVGRLALLGPVGHTGRRRPQGALRSWKAASEFPDPQLLVEVMRHNLAVHMLHAPAQEINPVAVHIHTQSCLCTRFRSKELSRGGSLLSALLQGRGPSLLVWGEHDVTAEPEVIAETLSSQLSGCKTHIVQGAAHWVQFERAEAINRLLLNWFSADPET